LSMSERKAAADLGSDSSRDSGKSEQVSVMVVAYVGSASAKKRLKSAERIWTLFIRGF